MSSVLFRSVRYAACSLSAFPSCSTWNPVRFPVRNLNCAGLLLGKDKTRKQFVEVPKVKKAKAQKKIVDIYEQMRVSELAKSVEETEETVLEMLFELHPETIDTLSSMKVLDDQHVLQVVSALGRKPRLVSRPANKENGESEDIEPLLVATTSRE